MIKDLELGCRNTRKSISQSSGIKFFPPCSFLSDQRGCVIGKGWIYQSKFRTLHVIKGKGGREVFL